MRLAVKIYVWRLLLLHRETNPACPIHQLRGDATPRGKPGVGMPQGSLGARARCGPSTAATSSAVEPLLQSSFCSRKSGS